MGSSGAFAEGARFQTLKQPDVYDII